MDTKEIRVRVPLRLPADLRDKLLERAEANDHNLSQEIRHILRREVTAQPQQERPS
jgi:hypothetical protein